jgi:hypothetical protein
VVTKFGIHIRICLRRLSQGFLPVQDVVEKIEKIENKKMGKPPKRLPQMVA